MRDFEKSLLKSIFLGLAYILAFPFFIPGWIKWLRSKARLQKALSDGWISCPYCRERNPLNEQGTCRRCGFTEYGSRLYCSNCKQVVARWIDCRGCGNSIKVW